MNVCDEIIIETDDILIKAKKTKACKVLQNKACVISFCVASHKC